ANPRTTPMSGSRSATTARRPRPPALANNKGIVEHATRSHPHPSPSQTGSRAARLPPKPGRTFLGTRENRENLIDQGDLGRAPKTVDDVPNRNNSTTRHANTGKIRGIRSLPVRYIISADVQAYIVLWAWALLPLVALLLLGALL